MIDDPELLRRVRELGGALRRGAGGARRGRRGPRARPDGRRSASATGIDAADGRRDALDDGLVINVPAPGMLRFLPPLMIDEADVGRAVETIGDSLA